MEGVTRASTTTEFNEAELITAANLYHILVGIIVVVLFMTLGTIAFCVFYKPDVGIRDEGSVTFLLATFDNSKFRPIHDNNNNEIEEEDFALSTIAEEEDMDDDVQDTATGI
ncbi:hypothetical protein L596_000453 [Steinernema carpocapsae]|uniref:Uncharacterized protein n=1 Tax=Steinernema carpocapsae TaxID=34508 RepID=A0A4U8UIV8_STECR|nr:hypothetical protein L596_000453 [Steinernema carpocapsae]